MSDAGKRGSSFGDRFEFALYGFLVGLILGIFIGWQFNFVVGTVFNVVVIVVLLVVAVAVFMLWRRFSTKRQIEAAVHEQEARDRAAIEAQSRAAETTRAEVDRRA